MLNVGTRTVQRARAVLDKGTPELVRAVEVCFGPVAEGAEVCSPECGRVQNGLFPHHQL